MNKSIRNTGSTETRVNTITTVTCSAICGRGIIDTKTVNIFTRISRYQVIAKITQSLKLNTNQDATKRGKNNLTPLTAKIFLMTPRNSCEKNTVIAPNRITIVSVNNIYLFLKHKSKN